MFFGKGFLRGVNVFHMELDKFKCSCAVRYLKKNRILGIIFYCAVHEGLIFHTETSCSSNRRKNIYEGGRSKVFNATNSDFLLKHFIIITNRWREFYYVWTFTYALMSKLKICNR